MSRKGKSGIAQASLVPVAPPPKQDAGKKQQQPKEEAKQKASPKTVKLGSGKRVSYEAYKDSLRDPIPGKVWEEYKDTFDSKKDLAVFALAFMQSDERMSVLGADQPLYYHPELAKTWFRSMSKLVHPDANDGSLMSRRAMEKLIAMYNRMIK